MLSRVGHAGNHGLLISAGDRDPEGATHQCQFHLESTSGEAEQCLPLGGGKARSSAREKRGDVC